MRRSFTTSASALALILLVSLAAAPTAAQEPLPPDQAAVGEPTEVTLFFVRNGLLAPVHRVIAMPEGKRIAEATMELLLDGPTDLEQAFGLRNELPFLVDLGAIRLDGAGVLTVTLEGELTRTGFAAEQPLAIAQIVHTLTQFPTVSAVRVLNERPGDPTAAALWAEVSPFLDVLLTREDVDAAVGGVMFEQPALGDRITTPLRLSGYANVFECQFQVRLLDLDGTVLGRVNVCAEFGEHPGRFETVLDFDADASRSEMVLLVVGYTGGASSERPLPNAVTIPLWLAAP